MDGVETPAPMLQGPASLHSREPGDPDDSNDDFVVITDSATVNGYDEAVDLFGSLSQADAVAQVKDLIQQRDELRKHFTACTKDLESVNIALQEQKLLEKRLCDQAKAKIDELNDELALYKAENVRLTQDLSTRAAAPDRVTTEHSPTASLIDSTVVQPQAAVENPTDAIFSGVPIAMDNHIPSNLMRESEAMAQLRGQLVRLQKHNEELEDKMKDVQEKAEAQIKNFEAEKDKAVRQTTTMSTHMSRYRSEGAQLKDQLIDANGTIDDLRERLSQEELQHQAVKADYDQLNAENAEMTRSILTPLRKKVADLESDLKIAQRSYEDVEMRRRGLEESCAALQSDCRKKTDMIGQVKIEGQREYKKLEAKYKELEEISDSRQSECERKAEMIEHLRKEKNNAEYRFEEVRVDKRKAEDLIAVLRSSIKESANRLSVMANLQTENRGLKQANSDYLRKIDELQQKLEEFNRNVGDEVPDLIRKRDEIKSKLKTEQATSDKLRDEQRELQAKLTKAETQVVRMEKKNEQQNKIITELKQKKANLEGQIIKLNNEIGELNSRNVTDGRGGPENPYAATTRATYEGVYHDRDIKPIVEEPAQIEPGPNEIHPAGLIKCVFEGCTQSGDLEYITNHIGRDHADQP